MKAKLIIESDCLDLDKNQWMTVFDLIGPTETTASEEHPESKSPVPPEKTETPVSVEYCTSAGPTETRYTTDPSTPLPEGGKWEKMGFVTQGRHEWDSPNQQWTWVEVQGKPLYRAILPNSPAGF